MSTVVFVDWRSVSRGDKTIGEGCVDAVCDIGVGTGLRVIKGSYHQYHSL